MKTCGVSGHSSATAALPAAPEALWTPAAADTLASMGATEEQIASADSLFTAVLDSLAAAGFDPHGMASFFDVLSRQNTTSPELRVPEFLRTHPVTTARVAEARNRARTYPRIQSTDTTNYGIAKARIIASQFDTPELAVEYFEQRDYASQDDAERYGRAVAYQRAGRHGRSPGTERQLSRVDDLQARWCQEFSW